MNVSGSVEGTCTVLNSRFIYRSNRDQNINKDFKCRAAHYFIFGLWKEGEPLDIRIRIQIREAKEFCIEISEKKIFH